MSRSQVDLSPLGERLCAASRRHHSITSADRLTTPLTSSPIGVRDCGSLYAALAWTASKHAGQVAKPISSLIRFSIIGWPCWMNC
jgi:hypothetical protein